MRIGALSGAFEEDDYTDFYLEECPDISVYVLSATTSLLFQVINVSLMVLMFFALKAVSQSTYIFNSAVQNVRLS